MCWASTNESIDFYPNISPQGCVTSVWRLVIGIVWDFTSLASALNGWIYWSLKFHHLVGRYCFLATAIGPIGHGFPDKHAGSPAELITRDLANIKRAQSKHDVGDQR